MHKAKRIAALLLALIMLLSMSGCNPTSMITLLTEHLGMAIQTGQRLNDSPWFNSDLEGAFDENTELDLKDDFHAAVNRDWLLETTAEGDEQISIFTDIAETLYLNIVSSLRPGNEHEPDPGIMSEEELDHLGDLIWDMMDLAGNWDKRNELGVEPLRPYLEAIEGIDSVEDLTAYIANDEGMNLCGENFFNPIVDIPMNERDYYTVHLQFPQHLLLDESDNYTYWKYESYTAVQHRKEALQYVLTQLGYSSKEASSITKRCYLFEAGFIPNLPTTNELKNANYSKRGDRIYTLEELGELQGNFPLVEILEGAGLAGSDSYRLYEPTLLNYMGRHYNEKHLESFKAYFTVHTVLEALPYLDEECDRLNTCIYEAINGQESSDSADTSAPAELTEQQLADLALAQNYVFPKLMEPFQLLYVGHHCSSTERQEILNMLEDIRDYYEVLLRNTEWLSEETREKAVEKLRKMEFNVIYPAELTDYSGLVYAGYDDGGNLLDAVHAINCFGDNGAELINQPVSRGEWDLNQTLTLDVNAQYVLNTNQINIFAGILSDGFLYDAEAPIEQNYARLGTILGHEMTHAFDTGGYLFDGEGLQSSWWTNDDEVAFRTRSDRLANHYTLLSVFPGVSGGYTGSKVQGEAIADMGGVKCMLALAEDIPDFDYELFFRSYASMWRSQTSLRTEMMLANDVHPLNFLRTNVTLQQFDKFYETFDIGPGDGMYLAEEDRISVW